MRFLLLAALALPAASAALPPQHAPARASAQPERDCLVKPDLRMARRPVAVRGVNRLGDEPAADLSYAVWSHVDGCYRPVKIREGIGFGAGQPPSEPLPRP